METYDHGLIQAALDARKNAYIPYSGYAVGAALLCKDGKLYSGCNVENAGYSPTNCAERTALFKAVSEGEREFEAIAVAGGKQGRPPQGFAFPCGVCRQALVEFAPELRVLVAISTKNYKSYKLSDLLPCHFGPKNID